ncbi:MAG: TlpA family protein disulfide reductase [Clostridia bacterium]|nr:TlpA family protein disulfide reductase [Clostridia bacterium]
MKKFVILLLSLAACLSGAALLTHRAEENTLLLPSVSPASSTVTPSVSPDAVTQSPTAVFTDMPTAVPTAAPPTSSPNALFTATPTAPPAPVPTAAPTAVPTAIPTAAPSLPDGTPDFTLTNAQGETKKLSDFLGKPIVLNFWASWCVPCQSELPAFQEAYNAYGQEVTFLMVSLDANDRTAKEFLENNGLTLPFWRDASGEGRTAYGITSIPQTLFLNARGEIVSKKVGALSKSALVNAIGQIR